MLLVADYIHSSYFYYFVMSLFYICNEAKQNLEQGLLEHKTGLRPHPPPLNNLLLTVPRLCFCCDLFYLSVCWLSVFLCFLFILCRIAWKPFAVKDPFALFYLIPS